MSTQDPQKPINPYPPPPDPGTPPTGPVNPPLPATFPEALAEVIRLRELQRESDDLIAEYRNASLKAQLADK
jgi:hypothetical protein